MSIVVRAEVDSVDNGVVVLTIGSERVEWLCPSELKEGDLLELRLDVAGFKVLPPDDSTEALVKRVVQVSSDDIVL